MKANTAGQTIGAQMVSATDGSAFTGAVTVFVTVDGGTQAQGTTGAGAATHEGNGFHSYSPSQAETNGAHVAFTFTGSGAIPATVQVYTTFPQTGDSFARIGAAGAGLTAINLPDQTMNITGNLSGSVGSVTGAVGSVTGSVASVVGNVGGNVVGSVGSISGITFPSNFGDLAITVTTGEVTPLATAVRTAIGLASANLDTQLDAIAAFIDAEIALILEDTGTTIPALIAALNDLSTADVNAEVVDVLKTDIITELSVDPGASPTIEKALMLLYMAARNKRDTTATSDEIHNNAGVVILEATVSDDGTVFSRGQYA